MRKLVLFREGHSRVFRHVRISCIRNSETNENKRLLIITELNSGSSLDSKIQGLLDRCGIQYIRGTHRTPGTLGLPGTRGSNGIERTQSTERIHGSQGIQRNLRI